MRLVSFEFWSFSSSCRLIFCLRAVCARYIRTKNVSKICNRPLVPLIGLSRRNFRQKRFVSLCFSSSHIFTSFDGLFFLFAEFSFYGLMGCWMRRLCLQWIFVTYAAAAPMKTSSSFAKIAWRDGRLLMKMMKKKSIMVDREISTRSCNALGQRILSVWGFAEYPKGIGIAPNALLPRHFRSRVKLNESCGFQSITQYSCSLLIVLIWTIIRKWTISTYVALFLKRRLISLSFCLFV